MITETSRKAAIVFGVYINASANWRKLIKAQLDDLRRFDVLSVCDLYVSVSNPTGVDAVAAFFDSLPIQITHIEFHNENRFEYPAISRVWNLADSHPEYQYIAYLHTKGMSYAKDTRDKTERALTHFTFSRWRKILKVFEEYPLVNKIGLFPAGDVGEPFGWMWFNFWWTRADFVRALPKPEETSDRFYYERWLGLSSPQCSNSYSIYSNSNTIFTGREAWDRIIFLRWRIQYGLFYPIRRLIGSLRSMRRHTIHLMTKA